MSDFEWRTDNFGDWNATGNWIPTNKTPNNPNHTVLFPDSAAITGPTTVVTNTAVTVNRIDFANATHQYIVAGSGSVNLMATTTASPVTPTIDALGMHQFQAIVNLHNDTTVNVSSASTLAFNNTLDVMSNTLTKTGDGTLAIRNDLVTGGGTVNLMQGTISGNGTIGGDVDNGGGTISPGNSSASVDVVPEPATCVMLIGMLVVALGRFGRRWR